MTEGLIETAAQPEEITLSRIYGVTVAQVINNLDSTGLGRVQLRLPWLPGIEPWARVGVLMAGPDQGTFFIPQVGDEVLVAFNHGDVREPYVIGCLWNGQDQPPASAPTDAVNRRIIRTPLGHEVEFDDMAQAITITSSTKHRIRLEPQKIEVAAGEGAASITLDSTGNVSIQGALSIKLEAPTITIQGSTVEVKGSAAANIDGGAACSIQAGLVKIN